VSRWSGFGVKGGGEFNPSVKERSEINTSEKEIGLKLILKQINTNPVYY